MEGNEFTMTNVSSPITNNRQEFPNCCKKVYRKQDTELDGKGATCIFMVQKCVEGVGHCDHRVNRWTGKKMEEGALK